MNNEELLSLMVNFIIDLSDDDSRGGAVVHVAAPPPELSHFFGQVTARTGGLKGHRIPRHTVTSAIALKHNAKHRKYVMRSSCCKTLGALKSPVDGRCWGCRDE